jgi:hypothetical protein
MRRSIAAASAADAIEMARADIPASLRRWARFIA